MIEILVVIVLFGMVVGAMCFAIDGVDEFFGIALFWWLIIVIKAVRHLIKVIKNG